MNPRDPVLDAALGYETPQDRVWIPPGGSHRAGAMSESGRKSLVSAVLEMKPEAGTRLVLLGIDVEGLRPAARAALRGRVGFVPADGGLISSLNAWENMVLPTGFHRPRQLRGVEARVSEMLRGLGADPGALLDKLPERMTPHERKLTGYVRIALEKPDLMLVEEAPGVDAADKLSAAYLADCPGGTFVRLEAASGP